MVDIIRSYCLSKHNAVEMSPFRDRPECSYMKVKDRIFAVLETYDSNPTITLKCNKHSLKEKYDLHINDNSAVQQNNSMYWSKFPLDGKVDEDILMQIVDYSYDLMTATRALTV